MYSTNSCNIKTMFPDCLIKILFYFNNSLIIFWIYCCTEFVDFSRIILRFSSFLLGSKFTNFGSSRFDWTHNCVAVALRIFPKREFQNCKKMWKIRVYASNSCHEKNFPWLFSKICFLFLKFVDNFLELLLHDEKIWCLTFSMCLEI